MRPSRTDYLTPASCRLAWNRALIARASAPAVYAFDMRLRREWDPYRVPRDLEWIGAVIAVLVVLAVLAYLLIPFLNVSD